MPTLTVLLPALRNVVAAAAGSPLAGWFARGDRSSGSPGRTALLRENFAFTGTELPVAALTRSLDGNDARAAVWVRADPAHVAVDAVAVRLLACGNVDLSSAESDELARTLRPLFGDAGFPLETPTPQRWYLRCPPGARLPRFAAPEDVLGDDLSRHLPEGDNARQWRHLLNEAQVILHNHPLNAARAQRGQVPINSLWFWGAGALPDWVRCEHARVLSGDAIVIALARLAGREAQAPLLESIVAQKSAGDTLLDLGVGEPAGIARDAFAALAAALQRGVFAQLQLQFESGERLVVRRSHRWRFWRRVRPLA